MRARRRRSSPRARNSRRLCDFTAGWGAWNSPSSQGNGAPVPTVTYLFDGDEEIGSRSSRPVIEEVAKNTDVTLVLEPSARSTPHGRGQTIALLCR